MTSADLYTALLRPAVLQILRAAGFGYAKPAVIDTVTDLAARYLLLLASSTAQNAFNLHNTFVPTIQDVRLALSQAGALYPQMSTAEESLRDDVQIAEGAWVPFEDLRGVEAFVNWAYGPVNKEIRRIAGFGGEANVEEIAAGLDDQEDYLSALKKRHSKTGEESRYQGTVLGKDTEPQSVAIVGGPAASIAEWTNQSLASVRSSGLRLGEDAATPATSGISSAPLTPIESE
ncbi:Bromodomain associated DNA binding protein [Cladophialophora carrionii]|uniref:Bromodomain associated DNA binding protein n=1 Tax=Cladophialophora carrionii TaxID=86049 RepID=A0A1C1CLG4_9EURO|nr:Bromodomain associated DNA binding protein [Cladophialophora carrionii]